MWTFGVKRAIKATLQHPGLLLLPVFSFWTFAGKAIKIVIYLLGIFNECYLIAYTFNNSQNFKQLH